MSFINEAILQIIHQKLPVSDLHIVKGRPLLGRWPRGYQAISKDRIVNEADIHDFLSLPSVLGADWKKRLQDSGGTEEIAISLQTARVRLSIYEAGGASQDVSIIGRLIPRELPPADALRIPRVVLEVMKRSKGLFIITGPTGAGKSTTLATMLQLVNSSRPVHILTLEDPIEYEFPVEKAVVSQREIGTNVPSFREGLTDALRQRPDIIAIGEVKDADSVETMLYAAESGHLVLATMHTRNSEEALNTLFSYFDKDELPQKASAIASTLIGITTQVLVPSQDGNSRHLASEIMLNVPAISQGIRSMQLTKIRDAIASGTQSGMMLLNQSLAQLVTSNKVSAGDAMYASYDAAELQRMGVK